VESSTCVYDIELKTPLACDENFAKELGIEVDGKTNSDDEL
jgi:hypothetical protein